MTRPRRTPAKRALVVLAVLLWVLAAPAGVAAGWKLAGGALPGHPGLAGAPLAAERINPGGVALGIRRVPQSGQGPHAAAEADLVAAVITDLETFWAAAVPRIAHQSFTPLRGGITAIDSAAPSGRAPCVSTPDRIVGNAYYCPTNDGIVYDSSALVPVLLARYGAPGLVGAFAHEFGHAVQARIGPTADQRTADPKRYPSLLIEAQGDCDAGAFLAWVVAGNAPHIHLDAGGMAAAVGPLLDFADPVTVSPTDPAAHGLSLDRLSSVLLGYRRGAAACHAMTADSLHSTLGEVALPPGGAAALATPRFPTTSAVLTAARRSIAQFLGSSATGASPGMGGPSVDGATPDAAGLVAATPHGQFAQATVLALAIGLRWQASAAGGHASATGGSVETPGGGRVDASSGNAAVPTGGAKTSSGSGGASGGRVTAACFAGAWTASVFGTAPDGSLGSWPGDADEGLDAVRVQPGATFADAAGYADGFHRGLAACR